MRAEFPVLGSILALGTRIESNKRDEETVSGARKNTVIGEMDYSFKSYQFHLHSYCRYSACQILCVILWMQ